jgi:hypothetical protein
MLRIVPLDKPNKPTSLAAGRLMDRFEIVFPRPSKIPEKPFPEFSILLLPSVPIGIQLAGVDGSVAALSEFASA